jgi:hypothetical protein
MRRRPFLAFLAANVVVWVAMVVILVVVPDTLVRWVRIEIARVVGWTVACAVWVVAVERGWQERFRPVARFLLQLVLWLLAAFVALWFSEGASLRGFD